jgi:hypothetical protein
VFILSESKGKRNNLSICDNRHDLLFGLSVAALACVVYFNSLGNGFVWDDDIVILGNPALKGNPLALFSGIDSGRVSESTPYYRPLTQLTFMAERVLHGANPYYVRLLNVLLHAVNSFLVYRLARSSTLGLYGSFLAAALFAVHPLNAEAVNFNSGGRNTMLAAFFLLSSYLVHRWSQKNESITGAWGGAVLLMAGLLSKETALAILPLVIGSEYAAFRQRNVFSGRQSIIRFISYLAVVVGYLILRHNALLKAGVVIEILPGLTGRLLANFYIIPRYLLNVVWPGMLSPRYFIPDDLHLYALYLSVSWLLIGGVLWWLLTGGRSRTSLFGLAWTAAFWIPVSGIVPIPSAPLADRYLYVSSIGIWLIVADQLGLLIRSRGKIRNSVFAATAMILVVLASVTVRLNLAWCNDIALFSRLVRNYPERAYGHHNLGCAYLDKDKNLDRAEKEFEEALALDPAFPRLRTQMGYARLLRNDFHGALHHYKEALKLNPSDAEAHLNSGIAFENLKRYDEAIMEYRSFLATPATELPAARPEIEAKILMLSHRLSDRKY